MLSRREILAAFGGMLSVKYLMNPGSVYAQQAVAKLPRRLLGRTGFQVVPLGLGGIGALRVTPQGMDVPDIIVRAIQLGINYFDTANVYGPSQRNYGEAFHRLNLNPDSPNYNHTLRQSIFVNSKTAARYAIAASPSAQGSNPADGARAGRGRMGQQRTAIDELKASLTQIFGDGQGYIPEGAYLDCMQIHDIRQMAQVDQIYEGLAERTSRRPEQIGALSGLLDFRDGTNYTGLNPEKRIWIRHIGITSHSNSEFLMRALRLDTQDIFDTMLIALNANDRHYDSMQNNILPMAMARGVGVIAMKLFSDGVMYGGPKRFLSNAQDLIQTVGKEGGVPSQDLVRYPLSFPGVCCAVTGIGKIDREKPEADQLVSNLAAAVSDMPDESERLRIEKLTEERAGTDTNFFQTRRPAIVQPTNVNTRKDNDRLIVEWNTALAGPDPIKSYEIRAGQRVLLSLPFRPQLTETPLSAAIGASEVGNDDITVVASTAMPRIKA
jgi:aryl-alcohol dehydrogenase-like predicted oxidoreductase